MRKRNTNNMHGGYRGSGVSLNWNTTTQQPLTPILPPNPISPEPQPLPQPLPDPQPQPLPDPQPQPEPEPEPLPPIIKPIEKNDINVAQIVGFTLGSLGVLAGGLYVKNKYGNTINQYYRRKGIRREIGFSDDPFEIPEHAGGPFEIPEHSQIYGYPRLHLTETPEQTLERLKNRNEDQEWLDNFNVDSYFVDE